MSNKLVSAKTQLVFEQPFFASILMKRPLIAKDSISTMGVDPRGNIYYNPTWVETKTREELMFVLCHEVMHVVCMHALRKGGRDHRLWNIAGDYYINAFLVSSDVGSMPKDGLYMDGADEMTTEEIYNKIIENQEAQDKAKSEADKDEMSGDVQPGEGAPLTPEEEAEEQLRTKLDVADAARTARERGKCKGALERMIGELLTTKMKWYEVLEKYFTALVSQKQSWARPNRRFVSAGAYLPTNDKEASLGTVVIGIDTSASIGPRELQYFGGHLNAILEQCRPEKVYVVYCDCEVNNVDEFGQEAYPVKLVPHGGGGTDMRQVVEWIEDNEINADLCCILTDGWTPYPETSPCPLVWAITESGHEPPLGDVVVIEESEE